LARTPDFRSVKTDYEEFWRRAESRWITFNSNARTALDAYCGKTWYGDEIRKLKEEGREAIELNLIRSRINWFSGYARDNIKSAIIAPFEGSDQKTADQLNEVVQYVIDKGCGDDYLLAGFDDCLKTGLSLVGIWIDKVEDPVFGDIRFYKRSYNSFILDPNFTRLDLSDCSEAILRDFVTKTDAKGLLPFIDPKVIDRIPTTSNDNKFQQYRPNRNRFNSDNLITFDSYYRRTSRQVMEIVDMSTGDLLLRNGKVSERDKQEELVALARQNGINAEILVRHKPFVELNIILGDEVVYSGEDPTGLDDYPFVAVMGNFEPQMDNFSLKIQGVVQPMIPAQRVFNRRMVRAQDVMDSCLNTGMLYKPSKVIDDSSMRQSGIGNIPATDDADLDRDFKPLQMGSVPPGWLEFAQTVNGLFDQISGVNESVLGMDDGGNTQISGRLAEVRAANGLRANRAIFDNFEKSQRYLVKKVMETIQINYGMAKIARIINEEPTPQFHDQSFEKYDAIIKQGVKSQSQRDSFYFELLRAREILGDAIPASLIIENMPMVGKSEVDEKIAQIEQQRQQQQQQMAILEQENQRRTNELLDAQSDQMRALAQERRGRTLSNIGLARERESQQQQNLAQADLDRAKTLTEIESLQTENFMKLMEFLEFLKSRGRNVSNENLIEDLQVSESFQGQPEQSPGIPAQTDMQTGGM
jgi:hypothetical protein